MRSKSTEGSCSSYCLKVTNNQIRWHYANEIIINMSDSINCGFSEIDELVGGFKESDLVL